MANDEIEIIKKPYKIDTITDEQKEEFDRCMESVLYFAENYVMISHPTLGRIPFKPFPYQKEMLKEFQKNRFNIALTARQMGKCIFGESFIKFNDNKVRIESLINLSFKDKVIQFLEKMLVKLS